MPAMAILNEIRRRARHVVGPFIGLTAVVYFAYHTVQGDRGLLAWWRLTQEIKQSEETLSHLEEVRDNLDHRAQLLRPEHLDADMLEERSRLMLNMGRDDEVVILRPHS
ncbi:septum formation initiator family protein [Telmatospirillum sp.]|uniref:FtsB family cell division protein n=1 Tax=Telmatospirillum sp. TaxID=2079197 RepID=UPI00284395AA|nr:septum formation initiator family protein [Telmatospirillum sp.]MDR3438266.1 septum formation initiator family protein [Telmatospirillum sp.]